jgi:hypothetical protein
MICAFLKAPSGKERVTKAAIRDDVVDMIPGVLAIKLNYR